MIWVLAGLYLGRDLAVLCHYAPLLTFISWGVCAAVLWKATLIARFGASHALMPVLFTAVVGTILFLVAIRMTREHAG